LVAPGHLSKRSDTYVTVQILYSLQLIDAERPQPVFLLLSPWDGLSARPSSAAYLYIYSTLILPFPMDLVESFWH